MAQSTEILPNGLQLLQDDRFFKRLSSSMQVVCKPRRLEGQAEADVQQTEMPR